MYLIIYLSLYLKRKITPQNARYITNLPPYLSDNKYNPWSRWNLKYKTGSFVYLIFRHGALPLAPCVQTTKVTIFDVISSSRCINFQTMLRCDWLLSRLFLAILIKLIYFEILHSDTKNWPVPSNINSTSPPFSNLAEFRHGFSSSACCPRQTVKFSNPKDKIKRGSFVCLTFKMNRWPCMTERQK